MDLVGTAYAAEGRISTGKIVWIGIRDSLQAPPLYRRTIYDTEKIINIALLLVLLVHNLLYVTVALALGSL
jgi:hypothetical protein